MRQLECDNRTSNALEVVAAARKGSWRRLLVDAVAEGIIIRYFAWQRELAEQVDL